MPGSNEAGTWSSEQALTPTLPQAERGNVALTPVVSQGEREQEARVLAVMYHYVRDADPLPLPNCGGPFDGIKSLSTSDFAAQLDMLCRTMEPIDWPRLYAWRCGRASIPQRCFLLTFDDGLTEHVHAVAPLLEERGLRGVFFVPGSVLTSHKLLAPHANHLLLATLGEHRVVRALADYLATQHGGSEWAAEARLLENGQAGETPGMDRQWTGYTHPHQQTLRARLKHFLTMRLPIPLRDAAMASIFQQHIGSPARWAKHWYLGWKDLRGLAAAGHTIGGHGFAHEPLARLTAGETVEDVRRSAEVLRDGLGPDPRPFSYPYGSVPESFGEALSGTGFVHAFTIEERWIGADDDVLRLPRCDTVHVDQRLLEEADSR